jgi:hypothetical protein
VLAALKSRIAAEILSSPAWYLFRRVSKIEIVPCCLNDQLMELILR